jgi:ACS family D-galactonate transporter-like MFS transporter
MEEIAMATLTSQETVRAGGWPQRWWRLFTFAFFFMMTMQIDKLNLSFMFVNSAFMQHFGLAGKPALIGALTGGFLVTYGFCAVAWGPAIHRWGGRRMAVVGIVAWAAIMILHAFATSYAQLLALRIVLGLVEACAIPLLAWFTANWLPFDERARGQAPWTTGIGIGTVITPIFVIWLLTQMPWQTTFYIFAALPLIPLVLLFWLPDDPAMAPGMPAWEIEKIKHGTLTNELDALKLPERRVHTFFQTLSSYRVWLIGLMDLGATAGFYGLITFGPVYLVRMRGFPATDMSYVLSGGSLVGAVCAILLAIDSDRRKRRAWYGFGLFVAGAIFLTAELLLASPAAAAVALALASASATPALVVIWSLTHSVAERSTIASTVGATAAVGIGLAGVINIAMGSLIAAQDNYAAGFLLVLVFYVVAAISALILALQRY